MDSNAQYRINPARVVFEFTAGNHSRTAWISIDALAAMAGSPISSEEQALDAYRSQWRFVHAAALGLLAEGQERPFIRRTDVD
jgi:hypothetical protein